MARLWGAFTKHLQDHTNEGSDRLTPFATLEFLPKPVGLHFFSEWEKNFKRPVVVAHTGRIC